MDADTAFRKLRRLSDEDTGISRKCRATPASVCALLRSVRFAKLVGMQVRMSNRVALAGALSLWMCGMLRAAEADGFRHFLYVSDKRIATVELFPQRSKAILNYINLDDVIELIEAPGLLVVDAAGGGYRGQLILNETPDDEGGLYRVSDLIGPKKYRGYDILGDFRFRFAPSEAYLRLGSRIIRLEPLSAEIFELEAAKIGELDLAAEPKFALVDAGFWRGYGDIYFPESPEEQRLRARFPSSEPLAPILLADPPPRLPSKWAGLPDPVVVRLRASVSAQGALVKLEVDEGVNPELDEQALETVRNSWKFLPAVADGEPAGAELVLRVAFQRSS